jgi:S-DNA-T family DNA segregation ATPase FtsK/SpoIIIE
MVGNIGRTYGEANLNLFGYLAYIDLLILLYPLYKLYHNRDLSKQVDFYVGWMILFISLILLQSLTLEFSAVGSVGITLKLFLLPLIGKAGLWLLWLLTFLVSLVLIFDDIPDLSSIKNYNTITKNFFIKHFKTLMPKVENPFFDKRSTDVMTTIVSSIEDKSKSNSHTIALNRLKKITDKSTPLQKRVEVIDEIEENSELLNQIEKGKIDEPKNFILPKLDFLKKSSKRLKKIDVADIEIKTHILLDRLNDFEIEGEVFRAYSGPLVTTFEFRPSSDVKISKIMSLRDDLAMVLNAKTIRMQTSISNRDVVSIEIPNDSFDTIYLRDILESELFNTSKSNLTIALGKDIVGNPFVTDLKKLPHLLIAGTANSGKSIGLNAIILSLLYKNDPDTLKLMLIDPDIAEFSIYKDIPHLLTPIISEVPKAIIALNNMVIEMERRYKLMAISKTKSIESYNKRIENSAGESVPYIVVVIYELAELMMSGGKDVEYSITRLAKMAMVSGIHLVVATKRPSVDVVTGLIKSNLPSRLSYKVGQRIDSKVILDALGADTLLGRGDALFTPPDSSLLVRLHAPLSSKKEIERVVEFLKAQREPKYEEGYLVTKKSKSVVSSSELDELYERAKDVILTEQKTSISYLQRKLQIGYNRSANIMKQLQAMGVLSTPNSRGRREILL